MKSKLILISVAFSLLPSAIAATPSSAPKSAIASSEDRTAIDFTNALQTLNTSEVVRLLPSAEGLWNSNPEAYLKILRNPDKGFRAFAHSGDPVARKAARDFLFNIITNRPRLDLIDHFAGVNYYGADLYYLEADLVPFYPLSSEWTNQVFQAAMAEYAGSMRSLMIPIRNSGIYNPNSSYEVYLATQTKESDDVLFAQFMKEHSSDEDWVRGTYDHMRGAMPNSGIGPAIQKLVSRAHALQAAVRRVNYMVIETQLIPLWSRLPSKTPEDLAFLEGIATAAKLIPDERLRIGLKAAPPDESAKPGSK